MPILNFHLTEGDYTGAQHEQLLVEASRFYAEILKCPIDRVRVCINLHQPRLVAVAGVPVSRNNARAPYFHFIVLEGRPLDERHRLLSGFTDIVVNVLGVDRDLVRGGCWPISPENWAIGGTPASVMREAEVRARALAAGTQA